MENYEKLVPQLGDDLAKYGVTANLITFLESKNINIKQVIYRSITLFVSALGRLYGVRKHSSFDIIEELKRRNELSGWAAQKLYLAVAVACHVRLVYYSSKNKQDDEIYREEEYWGREKFRELNKIVNKDWLLRSLAVTLCLQTLLRDGRPLQKFDDFLATFELFSPIGLRVCLGMDKDNIIYTEKLLNKLPTIDPNACLQLVLISNSYRRLNLKDKAVELFETLRRKLEKPYQAIDDSPKEVEKAAHSKRSHQVAEDVVKLLEAKILLEFREWDRAFQLTEELLEASANYGLQFHALTSILNVFSKISLWKFREALSSIRDLLRAHGYEKLKEWFACSMVSKIIKGIAHCLISLDKKEQGLHWAKQGLHFVEEKDLTSNNVKEFIDFIKNIKNNEASDLELSIIRDRLKTYDREKLQRFYDRMPTYVKEAIIASPLFQCELVK